MEKSNMRRTMLRFDIVPWGNFSKLAGVAVLLAGSLAGPCGAQQAGQKAFASAEGAAQALIAAAQNNCEKLLLEILGPEGKQIVSSGDDAEDAENRANIVKKYQEMHRLVKEPDGTTTLYIGAENWPTPIPLKNNKSNLWYVDTAAGKKEILFRRVGRNEMSAIRVCQELAAAQKEYRSEHHDEDAAKIYSDPGQPNGLYWKASEREPQSPVGPLLAAAGFADDAQA